MEFTVLADKVPLINTFSDVSTPKGELMSSRTNAREHVESVHHISSKTYTNVPRRHN